MIVTKERLWYLRQVITEAFEELPKLFSGGKEDFFKQHSCDNDMLVYKYINIDAEDSPFGVDTVACVSASFDKDGNRVSTYSVPIDTKTGEEYVIASGILFQYLRVGGKIPEYTKICNLSD